MNIERRVEPELTEVEIASARLRSRAFKKADVTAYSRLTGVSQEVAAMAILNTTIEGGRIEVLFREDELMSRGEAARKIISDYINGVPPVSPTEE